MNLPMRKESTKTIYARSRGIDFPPKIKKLLIGAEVVWFDKEPLSQDFGEALHFFFDTKTTPIVDLLLKKNGLNDMSQLINVPLHWGMTMELVYSMPNREESAKIDKEMHYFEFFGLMYPMNKKFIKNRDEFYLLKNMEFLEVPDSHKNKKFFETTKFTATVIGC